MVLIDFLLQWWLKVPPYLNHVLLKCGTYSQKAKSTTTFYEVSIPQCTMWYLLLHKASLHFMKCQYHNLIFIAKRLKERPHMWYNCACYQLPLITTKLRGIVNLHQIIKNKKNEGLLLTAQQEIEKRVLGYNNMFPRFQGFR